MHRGGDDEGVEDLVVAEDRRVRVGPLGRVDDGARRVEEAAARQERGAARAERVPELREGGDRDPADRQVDGRRDPFRVADPDHLDDRAGDRADPDDDQDRGGEGAVHDQQGERRVGAGDEEEDHRVIEAAHPGAHVRPLPVDPVVERAGAEQGREADRVDRDREGRLRGLGEEDQGGAEDERDEEGPLVGDAAQFRLDRGDRLGGRLFGGDGALVDRLAGGGGLVDGLFGGGGALAPRGGRALARLSRRRRARSSPRGRRGRGRPSIRPLAGSRRPCAGGYPVAELSARFAGLSQYVGARKRAARGPKSPVPSDAERNLVNPFKDAARGAVLDVQDRHYQS